MGGRGELARGREDGGTVEKGVRGNLSPGAVQSQVSQRGTAPRTPACVWGPLSLRSGDEALCEPLDRKVRR